MPDFTVFSVDDHAGRAETVTAANKSEAAAVVLAKYPGATTNVVPAEEIEGCNRTLLLWEWMGILERQLRGGP